MSTDKRLLEVAIEREPLKVARQLEYEVHRLSPKDVVDKDDYERGFRYRLTKEDPTQPYPQIIMAKNEAEITTFLKRQIAGGNPIPEKRDLARILAIIDSRPKGRIIESKLREEFGNAVIDALRQGRYVVSGSAGYNPPLLVSLKGRELMQGGNPKTVQSWTCPKCGRLNEYYPYPTRCSKCGYLHTPEVVPEVTELSPAQQNIVRIGQMSKPDFYEYYKETHPEIDSGLVDFVRDMTDVEVDAFYSVPNEIVEIAEQKYHKSTIVSRRAEIENFRLGAIDQAVNLTAVAEEITAIPEKGKPPAVEAVETIDLTKGHMIEIPLDESGRAIPPEEEEGGNPMTSEEIDQVASKVAAKVLDEVSPGVLDPAGRGMLLHFTEHAIEGSGLVVNEARAKASPCNCFTYKKREYCFSPGVIGMMSSAENPEQIADYCKVGKTYEVKPGIKERFESFAEAAEEAHKKIEELPKGERLTPWLSAMSESLAKRGVEI